MVCDNTQDEGISSLKVMFTTERGIEPFLSDSLKGTGETTPVPFSLQGRITLDNVSEDDLLKILYTNPLYHRCYLIVGETYISRERKALNKIYNLVFESVIFDFISPSLTFAVKTTRKGKHLFTSEEVSAYIGAAVIDGCRVKKGFRPKVSLDNPHLLISADVVDDRFFFGVELVGYESMHKRRWHIFYHRAGLKTTLANALLLLGEWNKKEGLLDPMCGSGTICVEAAHRCIKLPPAYFRKEEFIFLKSGLFSNKWKVLTEWIDSEIEWSRSCSIFASDRSARSLEGARLNARNALVFDKIEFVLSEAHELPDRIKESISLIVCNPPYGMRMGTLRKARDSLLSLFRLFEESRAQILSLIYPDKFMVEELADSFGFKVDKSIEAYNGNVKVYLLKLVKPS